MKAVDPNHMVTVGEEGFYGYGTPAASIATNPNSDNTGSARSAMLSPHLLIVFCKLFLPPSSVAWNAK